MLRIHNSLTGRKEPFQPIHAPRVGMYVCGVTVYDYCHVGHARCYVVFDVIRRWLRYRGYQVDYVRNVTDIDDKIIRRAAENGESTEALTARFGWSSFTEKADAIAERNMIERMPDDLAPDRREKLARLFAVVRRFAEEQHLAERKDRSKVVAGASVESGKETSAVLPMLAAVTEFKTSVEVEARGRARDVAHFGHNRAALVETAARIWRDPAGAVVGRHAHARRADLLLGPDVHDHPGYGDFHHRPCLQPVR